MPRLNCMTVVVDQIACRLNYYMSAVVCRPVILRPQVEVYSLCGCCKWCLLLLAGWCEGFYGVRESKALAAYL